MPKDIQFDFEVANPQSDALVNFLSKEVDPVSEEAKGAGRERAGREREKRPVFRWLVMEQSAERET